MTQRITRSRGRRTAMVAAALLATLACKPPGEGEGGHEGAPHEDAGDHAEASSAMTAWIEVGRPVDASLVELPARVVAAASSRSRLDAAFESTVVRATVQIGDVVAVGDPVVELRVLVLLEAAAILAGANAQIGSHQARRDRLEDLRNKGLVGAGDIFDVESGIGRLSADRRLALATLQSAGIDAAGRRELLKRGTIIMHAPIAGVIAELDAMPGDVVAPGESLAQILGRGTARIEVAHSGALPQEIELSFVGLDGSRFALDPTPVATAIEPGLGRTLAWYRPADDRELADGVRGRVQIGGDDPSLLEVPRRALRLHEGRAYVARHPEPGASEPEPVEVQVLRSAGSSALVRSDRLRVGDRVAADAATVLTIGRDPNEGGGHQH